MHDQIETKVGYGVGQCKQCLDVEERGGITQEGNQHQINQVPSSPKQEEPDK
jgi:hypothetical protein